MNPATHEDVSHDLDYWRNIADSMAIKYPQWAPYQVVKLPDNEFVAWPASREPQGMSKTVYVTGGEDNEQLSE